MSDYKPGCNGGLPIAHLSKEKDFIAEINGPRACHFCGLPLAELGKSHENVYQCSMALLQVNVTRQAALITSLQADKERLERDAKRSDFWPYHRSEWRGTGNDQELWWIINSEAISDRALRNWCANNMEGPGKHVDVVRLYHVVAYATYLDDKKRAAIDTAIKESKT